MFKASTISNLVLDRQAETAEYRLSGKQQARGQLVAANELVSKQLGRLFATPAWASNLNQTHLPEQSLAEQKHINLVSKL